MEHIVQFAVSIDDNAITKRVEEMAEREIIAQLKTEVANAIFGPRYTYGGSTDPGKVFMPLVKEVIGNFLEENKDVILDNASKMLATRLVRTKMAKELLNDLDDIPT